MADYRIDSAVNKDCGMHNALSFWSTAPHPEFASRHPDDYETDYKENPPSVYKENEIVVVIEKKDQQDWQEHHDAICQEEWVTLPAIACGNHFFLWHVLIASLKVLHKS